MLSRTRQHTREWRNWQTRTFEGRVVTPYGFKSRFSHQPKTEAIASVFCLPRNASVKVVRRKRRKRIGNSDCAAGQRLAVCEANDGRRPSRQTCQGCRKASEFKCPVSRTKQKPRQSPRFFVLFFLRFQNFKETVCCIYRQIIDDSAVTRGFESAVLLFGKELLTIRVNDKRMNDFFVIFQR